MCTKAIVRSHKALTDVRGIHTRSCSCPFYTSHNTRKFHAGKLPRGMSLPDDDQPVRAARHKPPGVKRSTAGPHGSVVAAVATKKLSIRKAPHANELVLATGEQKIVLVVECDESHRPFMPTQCGTLSIVPWLIDSHSWSLGHARIGIALRSLSEIQRLATFAWLPHLFRLGDLLYDGIEVSCIRAGSNSFSLPGCRRVRIASRLQPRDWTTSAPRPETIGSCSRI
mmetsp:Transcript_92142/g.219467  ORF Transcript_92142/g.219467 Transcript_92142/m.219467 type:complete len:226 (-) Transcript_92142:105-782(-)